jgi:hypothetical protein
MSEDDISFSEAIGDDDYGLIVCGKTGKLKGIWVPSINENELLPPVIISLMNNYFGVSPDDSETIH